MAAAPVTIPADATVQELVAQMRSGVGSAVVLIDPDGSVAGIVTEQDVVCRVALALDGRAPARQVASAPVLTVNDDDLLYRAIGFMRRHRLRHMPVLNSARRLVGLLHLHEALAVATSQLVEDIERLTHEETIAGLAKVKAAQVRLARNLLTDGLSAPEIQALLADINNDLCRRVLRLTAAELEAEGAGQAPVAFEAIVMGSGGRRESLLLPDQDNGFIIADYPDAEHPAVDAWFIGLAERMTLRLDGLGFPLCKGGVMATNPVWRKRLSEWRAQIDLWVRRRSPQMLLAADILMDFRCVHGDGAMSALLRGYMMERVRSSGRFMFDMFGIQAQHEAGIGWFGRFMTERKDPHHRGQIDVKLWGTLPLAEAARLRAMMAGLTRLSTLGRIAALKAGGHLGSDDADALTSGYEFMTGLQLRQQLADVEAGRRPGNFVDPATLTERERERLRDALRAVNAFRRELEVTVKGSLL
jgi:CBS domain-containing protein